jgi:hypothetical protein
VKVLGSGNSGFVVKVESTVFAENQKRMWQKKKINDSKVVRFLSSLKEKSVDREALDGIYRV